MLSSQKNKIMKYDVNQPLIGLHIHSHSFTFNIHMIIYCILIIMFNCPHKALAVYHTIALSTE